MRNPKRNPNITMEHYSRRSRRAVIALRLGFLVITGLIIPAALCLLSFSRGYAPEIGQAKTMIIACCVSSILAVIFLAFCIRIKRPLYN